MKVKIIVHIVTVDICRGDETIRANFNLDNYKCELITCFV